MSNPIVLLDSVNSTTLGDAVQLHSVGRRVSFCASASGSGSTGPVEIHGSFDGDNWFQLPLSTNIGGPVIANRWNSLVADGGILPVRYVRAWYDTTNPSAFVTVKAIQSDV